MEVSRISEETKKKIQPYIKLYSAYTTSVSFFDSVWNCIWKNDNSVFELGECLTSYIESGLPHPIREYTELTLYKGHDYYCARITPLKVSHYEPWLYICETLDRSSVVSMLKSTGAVADILPMFNAVHTNTSSMWSNFIKLKPMVVDKGYFEIAGELLSAEKSLCNICSATQNAYEYLYSLSCETTRSYIDGAALCSKLVKHCNEVLSECGRHIELVLLMDDLRFLGHGRLAASALVNAIQNALLYSPHDSTPVMRVERVYEGGSWWVSIKLTNDNILFNSTDFKGNDSINFRYQRMGFGIPIIRRFIQLSGGKLLIENSGRVAETTLLLPVPSDDAGYMLRLETSDYADYRTGIPTILEIKMREVVDFFSVDT